jgi:hypothetical protein
MTRAGTEIDGVSPCGYAFAFKCPCDCRIWHIWYLLVVLLQELLNDPEGRHVDGLEVFGEALEFGRGTVGLEVVTVVEFVDRRYVRSSGTF